MRATRLWPILLVYFLDTFGFAIVFPLFGPLLIEPQFQLLSPTTSDSTRNLLLGLLNAAFPVAQFFGAPFFGHIADRFGRKTAFLITLVGSLIGYALTAFSLTIHNILLLFISRLITGFFAGNLSICLAAISDLSQEPKIRAKYFSRIATLTGVSWVLAILISGTATDSKLLHLYDPATPFWICSILALINIFAIKYFFTETIRIPTTTKWALTQGFRDIFHIIQLKKIRSLYLVYFLFLLGWILTLQWFPAFSIEHYLVPHQGIILGLLLIGIVWSLGSSFLNKYAISHYPLSFIVQWSLLSFGILLLFSCNSSIFSLFIPLLLLATLFASLLWSNFLDLISLFFPKETQGKAMGITQSLIAFAQIIAPLFGALLSFIYIKLLYVFAACAALAAFAILFMLFPHITRPKPQ